MEPGAKMDCPGNPETLTVFMVSSKKRPLPSESTDITQVRLETNESSVNLKPTEFDPETTLQYLLQNVPDFLDIKDEQLGKCLLGGVAPKLMSEMAKWLLQDVELHKVDAGFVSGPPKWNYNNSDPFDCFDYYVATGCPNCGSRYELDKPHSVNLPLPILLCFVCGHRACPLHYRGDSEIAPSLKVGSGSCATFGDSKSSSLEPNSTQLRPVYLRGTREAYVFSENSKFWWQSRLVPEKLRRPGFTTGDAASSDLTAQLAESKAPTEDEKPRSL